MRALASALVVVVAALAIGCDEAATVPDRVVLERLVRAEMRQIKHCWHDGRDVGVRLLGAEGQTLVITAQPAGAVALRFKDPDNDRTITGQCLRRLGDTLRVPAFAGEAVAIEMPLTLERNPPPGAPTEDAPDADIDAERKDAAP